MPSRPVLAVCATLVAVLVPATAAVAHPGLRPNELRPGETIEAELIVPHGCGTEGERPEDAASASPTVELAAQWPEGIQITPVETSGWTTAVDDDVATWDDDGGATTDAILLPVRLMASLESAGDVLVPVFQGCANGESFRWVAAPSEEGDPGVALTVAGEPVQGPTPSPTEAPPSPTEPAPTATPSPTTASPTPTPTPTPVATATLAADDSDDDEGEDGDDGGLSPIFIGGILVGVAIASFVIWRRRSGTGGSP